MSPPFARASAYAFALSAYRLLPPAFEAVLTVVEGDPLHETGEHFLGRCFRLRLHADCRILFRDCWRKSLRRAPTRAMEWKDDDTVEVELIAGFPEVGR